MVTEVDKLVKTERKQFLGCTAHNSNSECMASQQCRHSQLISCSHYTVVPLQNALLLYHMYVSHYQSPITQMLHLFSIVLSLSWET